MARPYWYWRRIAVFFTLFLFSFNPEYAQAQTGCPLLDAPVDLLPADHATLPLGAVTLEWSAVPGAESYILWVHRVGDENPAPEISVGTNHYTRIFDGVATYVWTVRARPADPACPDGASPPAYLEFTVSDVVIKPDQVEGLQSSDGRYVDRVVVTWLQTTRAEYYLLYRAETQDSDGAFLAKVNGFEYADFSAQPGKIYFYTLKACNQAGCAARRGDTGWLGSCGQVELPIPQLVSPQPGSQLNFDAGSDFITRLDWSDLPDVLEYQVEIYSSSNGELLKQDLVQESQNGFYRQVPILDTVEWQVRAMDPVVGCPAGEWSERWSFTHTPLWTDTPTHLAASDGVYPDGILLAWEMPSPLDYDLEFFEIYRQAENETEIRLLARVESSQKSLLDTSAEPGVMYTYWVSAFGNQRGASGLSNPDQGYYQRINEVFLALVINPPAVQGEVFP